jgi:Putative transposase
VIFFVCIVKSVQWIYFLKQLIKHFSHFFEDQFWIIPGIVSVLHTFWAALNFNPHIHCLVTAWWLNETLTQRKSIEYKFFTFQKFKEVWKYFLVRLTKAFISKLTITQQYHYTVTKVKKCITQLYDNKKPKSLTVRVCDEYRDVTSTFTYTARYIKRPPISESRILKFKDNKVTFKFFDKVEKTTLRRTVSGLEFIKTLVIHIPDRHFKTIQYAWLFAPQSKKKYLKILHKVFPCPDPLYQKLKTTLDNYKSNVFSYKEKLKKHFWSDPRLCPYCKSSMFLSQITISYPNWVYIVYSQSKPSLQPP